MICGRPFGNWFEDGDVLPVKLHWTMGYQPGRLCQTAARLDIDPAIERHGLVTLPAAGEVLPCDGCDFLDQRRGFRRGALPDLAANDDALGACFYCFANVLER